MNGRIIHRLMAPRETDQAVLAAQKLATERMLLLIKQIQKDESLTERSACARAELDQSYLQKFRNGTKNVGIHQMRKTTAALGLPMAWFTDAKLGRAPNWREVTESGRSTAIRALLDELRTSGRPVPKSIADRAISIADREGVTTSSGATLALALAREVLPEG